MSEYSNPSETIASELSLSDSALQYYQFITDPDANYDYETNIPKIGLNKVDSLILSIKLFENENKIDKYFKQQLERFEMILKNISEKLGDFIFPHQASFALLIYSKLNCTIKQYYV